MPAPKRRTSSNEQDAAEQQKRAAQLEQIKEIVTRLEQEVKQITASKKQLALLDSVSKGLYDEVDKLSKKVPAETVTELVLNHMNDIIKEVKELISDDIYVQRLSVFVPAGDNPQHRDAVVVLRQIRQALGRYAFRIDEKSTWLKRKYGTARGIRFALTLKVVEGKKAVTKDEIEYHEEHVSSDWLEGYPSQFDFKKLDILSLETYFEEQ